MAHEKGNCEATSDLEEVFQRPRDIPPQLRHEYTYALLRAWVQWVPPYFSSAAMDLLLWPPPNTNFRLAHSLALPKSSLGNKKLAQETWVANLPRLILER